MHPAINGKDNCISIAIYCNRNLTEHIPKYSNVRDMNQPPTPQKQLTLKKKKSLKPHLRPSCFDVYTLSA